MGRRVGMCGKEGGDVCGKEGGDVWRYGDVCAVLSEDFELCIPPALHEPLRIPPALHDPLRIPPALHYPQYLSGM